MTTQWYQQENGAFTGYRGQGKAATVSMAEASAASYNRNMLTQKFNKREAAPRKITQSKLKRENVHKMVDAVYFRRAQVEGFALDDPYAFDQNYVSATRGRKKDKKLEGRYTHATRANRMALLTGKTKAPRTDKIPKNIFTELNKLEARGFDKNIIFSVRAKLKAGQVQTLTPTEAAIYPSLLGNLLRPMQTALATPIPVATPVGPPAAQPGAPGPPPGPPPPDASGEAEKKDPPGAEAPGDTAGDDMGDIDDIEEPDDDGFQEPDEYEDIKDPVGAPVHETTIELDAARQTAMRNIENALRMGSARDVNSIKEEYLSMISEALAAGVIDHDTELELFESFTRDIATLARGRRKDKPKPFASSEGKYAHIEDEDGEE